jgi:hypothetical protein
VLLVNRSGNSPQIFGGKDSETLLSALFLDRFGEKAWERLDQFIRAIGRTELSFDFLANLRKHEYPGYAGYEAGLPTVYYYFVPGSGWGSDSQPPLDPLHPSFVRSTDGFGLNLGCPLRLSRAIEILEGFPEAEQTDCRRGLASSTQHLATVEELLWIDAWNTPVRVRRIVETTSKTYDWRIAFPEIRLRIECKFRPSDWPRLIDGATHIPMPGALTGKARDQLGTAGPNEINLVAVTGVAPVTKAFRAFCGEELSNAPNIGVLVYRRFVGETAVFSLDPELAGVVARNIPQQPSQPFQPFYFMLTHRAEAARRQKRRQSVVARASTSHADLTELEIPSLRPRRVFQEPPLLYRCNLRERLPSGEPVFEHVSPYTDA